MVSEHRVCIKPALIKRKETYVSKKIENQIPGWLFWYAPDYIIFKGVYLDVNGDQVGWVEVIRLVYACCFYILFL